MRTISSDIAKKISNPIQTKATNCDPVTELWIGRLTTPLTTKTSKFLERQTVLQGAITDSSVAVCHPRANSENTRIFIGYVMGGVARVTTALAKTRMAAHAWADVGFSENAEHISIAFDGTMPKNVSGRYEFITESLPWIFWESGGILYARKLGSTDTTTLASANCTWISAVRATWSEIPGWDFGLCIFFIVSGSVYYRQFIGGVWYDAEVVPASVLPALDSGVTWTEVAASRTWDYRVVLQLKASDGALYEVFTQFGGLGSKGAEHIEVRDVAATGKLTAITYHDTAEAEHIEISGITPVGKLRLNVAPGPSEVKNVDDGTGVWDKQIQITLDRAVIPSTVPGNVGAFAVTNAASASFAVSSAACSADGLTITLSLSNALTAGSDVTVSYTPGSIDTDSALYMATWTRTFTPTHLTKPDGHEDEHIEISSIAATGTLTAITYRDTTAAEHIEIVSITASGTLTNVHNI